MEILKTEDFKGYTLKVAKLDKNSYAYKMYRDDVLVSKGVVNAKTKKQLVDVLKNKFEEDKSSSMVDGHVDEYVNKKTGDILRIYIDEDAESPREWDNLGIMITSHRRYSLGDEQFNADNFDGWNDVKKYLIKDRNAIKEHIYPLYLYDHSGLRIKIGSFSGLLPQGHAEFDSGMVGYIFTTPEKLKMMGTPKSRIKKLLEGEVETYDEYLSGQVYGFRVYDRFGNEKESIWGHYGSDIKKNGILENAGINNKDFEKYWEQTM